MLIYTEITPNPHSLKFIVPPEYPLIERGTREVISIEEMKKAEEPLLRALGSVPGIKSLFFTRAFLTVTKEETESWHTLIPQVKEVLKLYLPQGPLSSTQEDLPSDPGEIERRIREVLDEYIRPGVAMDGGDVEFLSYADGVVRLRLRGSCSGCPSSIYTLKAGIETLLSRLIPEVQLVEAEAS
ncbi:MAG: NifU family protein [Bacteroidia bacterium]|nr:NifU family protein [Bacteroidia bacterium]MDW8014383.1 NifU family protein [Bacteroidia bacterium]